MANAIPYLFVQRPAEKALAEALVRPYAAEISSGGTGSGTIAHARYSLLVQQEHPVIVLLGTETENPRQIEESRGSIMRLLARFSLDGWYVALAVPRLDSWAMTDPWIKQHVEASLNGQIAYSDRLALINKLLRTRPFEPTELLKTCPDYKGLLDFLQKHAPAAGTTASPEKASCG
jgi:hypothetical protein